MIDVALSTLPLVVVGLTHTARRRLNTLGAPSAHRRNPAPEAVVRYPVGETSPGCATHSVQQTQPLSCLRHPHNVPALATKATA